MSGCDPARIENALSSKDGRRNSEWFDSHPVVPGGEGGEHSEPDEGGLAHIFKAACRISTPLELKPKLVGNQFKTM